MVIEIIKNYQLLISISLLLFICFTIRYLSPSIYDNNFLVLNNKSYFRAIKNFTFKNNSQINYIPIKYCRIFFITKKNNIKLYLSLSNSSLYDEKMIDIPMSLYINNSAKKDSINISFNGNTNILNVTFNDNNTNTNINNNFSPDKISKDYSLNHFSMNFNENYTVLNTTMDSKDFDINIELYEEKYTYKVFYALKIFQHKYFYLQL